MTRFVASALLLILFACASGEPILDGLGIDSDGDGVVNADDCAPSNAAVWGDSDGDGWLDMRCLDAIAAGDGYPVQVPDGATRDQIYLDCDDDDPDIHPCCAGGCDLPVTADCWLDPDYYEHAPDVPEGTREVCAAAGLDAAPGWAYDRVDNDCDGSVDVPDFDGDGFVAVEALGGDCDDCMTRVNPGMDEWQEEGGCPIYAYDGVDNDCDGSDVDDLDDDGQAGLWVEGSECGATRNQTTDDTPLLSDLTAGNEDCYDKRVDIYLGAPEFCDWVDHDCSGEGDALAPESEDVALNGFERSEDGLRYVLMVDAATTADPGDEATGGWGAQTGRSADEALPGLQAAVPYVALCSEVHFAAGEYEESVALDLDDLIVVTEDESYATLALHLVGPESGDAAVLRGASGAYLDITLGAEQRLVMQGLQHEGSATGDGGVLVIGGHLLVEDSSFSGIVASVAAPLELLAGSTATLSATSFSGNEGVGAGGVSLSATEILVSGVTATDNVSRTGGGGLSLSGFTTAQLRGTMDEALVFSGNSSGASGGGISAIGGVLTGEHIMLSDGRARNAGGGLYAVADSVDLAGLVVDGCEAELGSGGGVHVVAGAIDIVGLDIEGGLAAGDGGGWYSASEHLSIADVAVSTSTSGSNGGGLAVVASDVALSGAQASGNTAAGGGGGIFAVGDTVLVTALDLSGNQAGTDGAGASLLAAELQITEVDARSNLAGGLGGGLMLRAGDIVATDLRLDGNEASGGGGARVDGDDVVLERVAVVSDSAPNRAGLGDGGGLSIDGALTATLSEIAITDATASGYGGGLFLTGGALTASGIEIATGSADAGGGAYVDGDDVSLSDVSFVDSSATAGSGGGLAVLAHTVAIEGLDASGGSATVDGGCVSVVALTDLQLDAATLSDCEAAEAGGAVHLSALSAGSVGDLSVSCSGTESMQPGFGGGLAVDGSSIILAEVDITGCSAGQGGGAYLGPLDSVEATGLRVFEGSASERGGGVAIDAQMVTGSGWSLSGGTAPIGGGLYTNGVSSLSLTASEIVSNRATGPGGGAFLSSSGVYLGGGVLISDNEARTSASDGDTSVWCEGDELGGGLYVLAGESVELDGATVSGNTGCHGAGLAAVGVSSVSISETTFSDNETASLDSSTSGFMRNLETSGGGLYVSEAAELVVDRSLFESNSAGYEGGGIYAQTVGLFEVTNSRFLMNEARVLGYPPIGLLHGVKGRGGAIFAFDTDVQASYVEFLDNSAQTGANAVHVEFGKADVEYSVFYGGESSSYTARAAHVAADYGEIEHSTFVHSEGVTSFTWMGSTWGYGLYMVDFGFGPEDSSTSVDTSIFADSDGTAIHGADIFQAYCDLFWEVASYESPVFGGGDVEADPLFVSYSPDDGDPTNDDLNLGSGSPAIDPGCGFGEIGAYGYGSDWSDYPF